MSRGVRLVMPHQLFEAHLDAPDGTAFVLVEHDLLFRQYAFHQQKLVLHRASMRRFAERLRGRGFDVELVETDGRTTSRAATAAVLKRLAPDEIVVHDVVDDWLEQDLATTLGDVGHELSTVDTPNFLTTRAQLVEHFGEADGSALPRMQHFYAWQRRRLGILVDADGAPEGGRWSFDAENRKKLPRDHPVPPPQQLDRDETVDEAIAWVKRAFGDNPGDADSFDWPTSHAEADRRLEEFLSDRFAEFGPYEDAISADHAFVFHSLLTPGLNIGLLSPQRIVRRALDVGESTGVSLASLEGFVRQVIGWREYMRATYHLFGRRLRGGNRLEHGASLSRGWWTGETGLDPVDLVVDRVLRHGYAHHIERLMVLGNAMSLLRADPHEAYEWFMEMFVDAYDWVMVPNVYAMSQFAAGAAITTKPYVSGSNYLRKMSDLPPGDWCDDWDALYWTFVRDHRDVFESNPRSSMMVRQYDAMDPAKKAAHTRRAARWL